MKENDFDIAVLGAGSAGYAAARTAAQAGRKVALVEGGKELGGLCILRGCMPTKALLYAAEVRHLCKMGPVWGIHPREVSFNLHEVIARKDRQIREFADYRRQQLEKGKFTFLRAQASFQDAHTLLLDNGTTLRASHFIVCTGSKVSEPPLADLSRVGYMTSDDALTCEQLPESMVVLGGGAVALEFAQYFARFGVKVTVIQRSPQVLRDLDTDCAKSLEGAFRREGIKVYTGTRLLEVRRSGALKTVVFEHQGEKVEVVAEQILHALGRTAATDALGLERAGVATIGHHQIRTDLSQRTSVPHIYAAGDCTGPHEIVHVAIQQGEIAAHNILHPDQPRQMDYRLLVHVVFTDPQVAQVGLNEKEAKASGIPFLASSYPFNDHGKSLIMEALDGFVKLLADPTTGKILGGSVVGPVGGELIHEIVVAMAKNMTVQELAATPHYHPTLAEIWTYPAEDLAAQIPAH